MNVLRGRGRHFRFPLVAAQRLRPHERSFVTARYNKNSYGSRILNTDPVAVRSMRSFSTTFSKYQTLKSSDVTSETQQSTEPSLHERTAEVYRVLRNGEPRQMLTALANPINEDVIASLPESVFVSALLSLTPEYFIQPSLDILKHVHQADLLYRGMNPFKTVLNYFFQSMNQILWAWRSGGNTLGLVEYKHLLRISAQLGHMRSVTRLWEHMKRSGIEPDLQCYNFFLHALVWDHAVYGPGRYRLRVSPYYYRKRLRGHHRLHKGFGTGGRSVRKEANSIVLEMRRAGFTLDEDTYINLLLADARVGDRSSMNHVMNCVWMVDLKALAQSPDEVRDARPLAGSSPIYPTRELLFAVAHTYGSNSMFTEALLGVTHISNEYGIEITDDIWAEFLERGFVLSRKRHGKDAQQLLLGRIDPEILFQLKPKLQLDGKPYDMIMYRMLAKATCFHKRQQRFQEVMREAYKLLQRTRRERDHALRVLENSLGVSLDIHSLSSPIKEAGIRKKCEAPHVWRALQRYEILRLLVAQQQITLEKIAWFGVVKDRWSDSGDFDWTHRGFPSFIAEWKDFLPESFRIRLPTSFSEIEFVGRTTSRDLNIRKHDNEPVRWSSCGEFIAEEDDQIQVRHEVLWAHAKDRLGELANHQPLQWFLSNILNQTPNSTRNALEKEISDKDEFKDDPKLAGEQLGWAEQQKEVEQEVSSHGFYVTMVPQFNIAL